MKKKRQKFEGRKPVDVALKSSEKVLKSRNKTVGQQAGSLIHIGEKLIERPLITVYLYDGMGAESRTLEDLGECRSLRQSGRVLWLNIDGLHDTSLIQMAGDIFGIEPLTLEDILHTGQRAKVEDFDRYLYLVLQMLEFSGEPGGMSREQLSIVVGEGFVLTFQEKSGDMFDPLRQRIGSVLSKPRKHGADYLVYALCDAVVDHYLSTLEEIENTIDRLEGELMDNYNSAVFGSIYTLKRELIILRKSVWPLREAIGRITRDDFAVIGDEAELYFRDVYDHVIMVIDTIEVFRDIVTGMHETWLASVNNRMNEVMKFLTMIATIFMPLSFIAGVYGMNFRYMPELEWRWGYFAVLGVMAITFTGIIWFYRSRKWY